MIGWIVGHLLFEVSKPPHLLTNNTVDAIATNKNVAMNGGAVVAYDCDIALVVFHLQNPLLQLDLSLVLQIVVQNTQSDFSFYEKYWIAKPVNIVNVYSDT